MIEKTEKQQEELKAAALATAIRSMVKEELVGLTEEDGENGFLFILPGGKKFRVLVEEV